MASTYSQYKIELIGTGEQPGIWGNTTNNNFGSSTPGEYRGFEQAIGGKADVNMDSITKTLSLTNSSGPQDARALYLNLTGTPGGAAVLEVPAIQKGYLVKNGSNQVVTVKVTGQTGVAVPVGATMWLYNNGTDVVTAVDHISSLTLGAALPVASGGTGATTLTSNNVILGNGTSAVTFVAPGTNGNILTSNGTTWTSAPAPASGVTTFSAGTTGFTPNTATGGAITLAGTLGFANGGTGLTTLGTAGQALVVNSGATALEYGSAGISTGKAIAMAIVFG